MLKLCLSWLACRCTDVHARIKLAGFQAPMAISFSPASAVITAELEPSDDAQFVSDSVQCLHPKFPRS